MGRKKGKTATKKVKGKERDNDEIAVPPDQEVSSEEVEGEESEEEPEEEDKKPRVNPNLEEITTASEDIRCMFCSRSTVDEPQYGKLYKLNKIIAHYFCILFSSNTKQGGADHEGIQGFLETDILKEHRRGQKLRCQYCRRTHATIGCVIQSCRNSFHFTCGSDNGTLHTFLNPFPSYCTRHKWREGKYDQVVSYIPVGPWGNCEICLETCDEGQSVLSPPCCQQKVYHKLCLQRHATFFGSYHLRCPNLDCQNKLTFVKFLREAGVHVPVRDAAWEKDERYEAMKKLRYRCDAMECLCEEGRGYNNKNVPYRKWKIIRCGSCGGSGTHIHCGNLKKQRWKCPECVDVLKRGCTPIVYQSDEDDDSSDESGEEQDAEDGFESPNLFFEAANVEEVTLTIKTPVSSNSGSELVYDPVLNKNYKVAPLQIAADSDSDSDTEVVQPEIIISSKPLHRVGPVTLRRLPIPAQIAEVHPANPSGDRALEETADNTTLPLLPPSTATSKDTDQLPDEPVRSNSTPVSEDFSVDAPVALDDQFDDGWTEVPAIGTASLSPTESPPEGPRKRKSDTSLECPTEKRNSPVREAIDTESSSSNVDCFDDGPCSPEIILLENTDNPASSATRKQPITFTEFEYKRVSKKNKEKRKNNVHDDEIRIIRDTRVQETKIVKKNKEVPLIELDSDDDDKASR